MKQVLFRALDIAFLTSYQAILMLLLHELIKRIEELRMVAAANLSYIKARTVTLTQATSRLDRVLQFSDFLQSSGSKTAIFCTLQLARLTITSNCRNLDKCAPA